MITAKVAVSALTYGIDKPYDYEVPAAMQASAEDGMRVYVPFGRGNRFREGIILKVAEERSEIENPKQILHIIDDAPVYSENMLKLAAFIKKRYFCTFFEAAKLMLPSGMWTNCEALYCFSEEITVQEAYARAGKSRILKEIINLLSESDEPLTETEISEKVKCANLYKRLSELRGLNIIRQTFTVRRNIYDKFEKTVSLKVNAEAAAKMLNERQRKNHVYGEILNFLQENGETSQNELCCMYKSAKNALSSLYKCGAVEFYKRELYRRPPEFKISDSKGDFRLNDHQQKAFDGLVELFNQDAPKAALLFGVTGSGKTEVYIRVIRYSLEHGKGALVLVPEIALTPQLASRFTTVFGDCVAVLHSGLTQGQRLDEWKRVKNGKACIAIGTRSAVFAPINNLGVIIIDEEHDSSFCAETSPKYNAADIAKYRCLKNNALLILGSATPSVESYYNAMNGKYSMFCLAGRYGEAKMPDVIIADMRGIAPDNDECVLGKTLTEQLAENIKNHEQSIVLLNRRGTDRLVRCVSCGYVPECANCSNPLTFHEDENRLICHYCGYNIGNPESCPQCGKHHLSYIKAGTQKLERQLKELFPTAKISRLDADTAGSSKSREEILGDMYSGAADILVGTQMVTKGLDFDNVTLVGVTDADMSLYAGDYKASERTFSLITQVIGRAGRRSKRGRAVIQTMSPDNSVIKNAARQDYPSFYNEEIQTRYTLELPPFCDIIVFTISSENEKLAAKCGKHLARRITGLIENFYPQYRTAVLGPIPARTAKLHNKYRYTVMFRAKADNQLRKFAAAVMREFCNNQKNRNVSISIDINNCEI